MIEILEYVKEHSTLILVVLGLILLAIVGYYADKTNFGQGKKTNEDNSDPMSNKKNEDFSNVKLNEVINKNNSANNVQIQENVQNLVVASNEIDAMPIINQTNEVILEPNIPEYYTETNINKNVKTKEEESFNEFEEEFEMVLPKKNLISEDLLNDIDELELGKTQKINLSEVPDLDDIDLPKIKNLVAEEQDVWKF